MDLLKAEIEKKRKQLEDANLVVSYTIRTVRLHYPVIRQFTGVNT